MKHTRDTTEEFRWLAASWHSGQWSHLYAYSSSLTIRPGIVAEIKDNIRFCENNRGTEAAEDLPRLKLFLAHVEPIEKVLWDQKEDEDA